MQVQSRSWRHLMARTHATQRLKQHNIGCHMPQAASISSCSIKLQATEGIFSGLRSGTVFLCRLARGNKFIPPGLALRMHVVHMHGRCLAVTHPVMQVPQRGTRADSRLRRGI